ncbi:MAG: universal stress protein [Solirubrobacterales bacterium]|nr:universal stress protein [Solirubrobacterales bacterium]
MPLFKRIVVGTDGSDSAREAVRQAAELARLSSAELIVVSAYEPVPPRRSELESRGAPDDVSHEFGPREEVNFILEAASSIAAESGVEATLRPRDGDPADAILTVADEVDADLIVVGNRGMTGARRFLLGSVPNKVSHHAPCSVQIARTT